MNREYKYVVIFIKKDDQILMLNRNKPYWMGYWNGVGGKIENNENFKCAAIREVYEETGIKINDNDLNYMADLNWYVNNKFVGGTYCFLVEAKKKIKTPQSTREGILEWKDINWICNLNNKGIVPDAPKVITNMLTGEFTIINTYYDENDNLISIENQKEDCEEMDNLKKNIKKAGYVAVGAGAIVYEKGKEVYERVAPHVNESLEKVKKNLNTAIDELSAKGEEVLNKKKEAE